MKRLILSVFKTLIIVVFVFYYNGLHAQGISLWSNPITGTNNIDNPYTSGQSYLSGLVVVSGIERGTGITGVNANNRYNAESWNSASLDTSAYFNFTIKKDPFYYWGFTLHSMKCTSQASANGPSSFAVRTSVDNFSTNVATPAATGDSVIFGYAPNYLTPSIVDSVTIRIYAWGASSSSGTFSIDDFQFYAGALPLSIKIENFTATKINNSASLSWQISGKDEGEKNAILHSVDGETFTTLGTVEQNVSSWVDNNPAMGMNYYKLEIINPDAKINYSNVLSLNFSHIFSFNYYPNPAKNVIHANVSEAEKIRSVNIYSLTGVMIYHSDKFENNIDITSTPNGFIL